VFDAIVLAGGRAARLDGADKPGLELGGRTLLERAVAAVNDAARVIVVGPPRPLPAIDRPVLWCREEPAGSGPVAALAAGLSRCAADLVVTLAADLPWIAPAVPVLLAAVAGGASPAAALVDGGGRVNYLAAAWRRPALEGAIASLPDVRGASMRALTSTVPMTEVPDPHRWGRDCDTWADLADARNQLDREGTTP
jgi:molybdopterin-guanine dinucleotide biosynthesis protein A